MSSTTSNCLNDSVLGAQPETQPGTRLKSQLVAQQGAQQEAQQKSQQESQQESQLKAQQEAQQESQLGANAADDAIVVRNACKSIKNRVVLSDVSLNLKRNGIYGFSGINGSGKTMLFRAIAGLIRLDSGSVNVFGETIGKDRSFPRNLGLIIDSIGFWDEYSGFRNLQLLASIKRQIGNDEIRAAIERVGLNPDDKRNYRKYSLGMRQRLGIAQAIMERPELLLLDEPTNALDSDGVQMVVEVIAEQQQNGATILIASHNVDKLDALCSRRFRMYEGKLNEEQL